MASQASAVRTIYRCDDCGWSTPKWVGRCGECQSWGTVQQSSSAGTPAVLALDRTPARPIGEVDAQRCSALPTGVGEFDRVLGGGLVPGSVVLLAGEPGVGKSTLLLDAVAHIARAGRRTLYVTGEESAEQVRLRAERIGAVADLLYLAAETHVGAIADHVRRVDPEVLVIDSVQTLSIVQAAGAAGGSTQVRESAAAVIRLAKERHMSAVLIGHVTKDGSIAGPRTLEHLVDVVLGFEGDRHARLRMVRAVKNRFGPTDEVGCFELNEDGIVGLPDPSGLFVTQRCEPVPGTCLTVAMEGRRPLLAEIQALLVPGPGPGQRRTTSGLDASRMAMVLAVMERRLGLPLSRLEAYIAPVGGVRLLEPATDLAAALASYGSVRDLAAPAGWAAFGEVGLAGDLRPVPGARQRIAEAARLGIHEVVLPDAQAAKGVPGVRLHPAPDLGHALRLIPWISPHATVVPITQAGRG